MNTEIIEEKFKELNQCYTRSAEIAIECLMMIPKEMREQVIKEVQSK